MINMPHQQIVARAFEKIHGEKNKCRPDARRVGSWASREFSASHAAQYAALIDALPNTSYGLQIPNAPCADPSRIARGPEQKNGVTEKKNVFAPRRQKNSFGNNQRLSQSCLTKRPTTTPRMPNTKQCGISTNNQKNSSAERVDLAKS
ncbi:hypothetical protein ACFS07_29135 [Undibacterium arcticum]